MNSRFTKCLGLAVLFSVFAPSTAFAGVLPEERADTLYHFYDGGGVQIDGPSVLVRKNIKQSFSVFGNYYVDNISSASIDVVTTGASPYTEERTEVTMGLDYLKDDTLMSISLTDSEENDYSANSLNIGINQDVFGGMTTIFLGYGVGSDEVRRNLPDGTNDPSFREDVDRRNYRLGVTQVITRNMVLGLNYETITDEGFLNNPYRSVRFLDPDNPSGFSFEPEVYPNTRTSNALGLRSRYHLRGTGAIHGGYRFFTDTWGINAHNVDVGYTKPWKQAFLVDLGYRYYTQNAADFYSDLFPYEDSQNFLARDKELSTFNSHTIRLGMSYDLVKDGWRMLDRATVSFYYDRVFYDYEDFSDLRHVDSNGSPLYPPGQEPAFNYSADIFQLFFSIWF
jgi:opacity protein-like surface antigen